MFKLNLYVGIVEYSVCNLIVSVFFCVWILFLVELVVFKVLLFVFIFWVDLYVGLAFKTDFTLFGFR